MPAVHWGFGIINGCSYSQIISAFDFQDQKSRPGEVLEANARLFLHHMPASSTGLAPWQVLNKMLRNK